MSEFNKLIKDTSPTDPSGVEKVRTNLANKNQFMAAQDVQKVQSRYQKDIKEGVAVQSAEVARVLKGESGLDGLLKRFASSAGLSRNEIKSIGTNYGNAYDGTDVDGRKIIINHEAASKCPDLVLGINLYDTKDLSKSNRVGYNIVDLLDNVYTQLKKNHRVPALPADSALTASRNEYLTKDATETGAGSPYDVQTSKLLSSSNVKDIRDFAKKALLPYVTAFFRAFELSDEMIHAAIEAKSDTNAINPLKSPVVPIDTRGSMMYALNNEGLREALTLASMGSDPLRRLTPLFEFASATSRIGGTTQEGGKKKKSSKKRTSVRKMRGGDEHQEGGKKKKSSKKRSSSKKHGGAKKRSSKKRSSGRKMRGGDQEGGKKKKKSSSKKRSSGRKMRGGDQEGGKKKKSSSKKRSSGKRRGGAKKRSSKKRSSARKH